MKNKLTEKHVQSLCDILNRTIGNVVITHEEPDGRTWLEITADLETVMKSIIKVYNGLPRQIKPLALSVFDHSSIILDAYTRDIIYIDFFITRFSVKILERDGIPEDPSIRIVTIDDYLFETPKLCYFKMKGDKIKEIELDNDKVLKFKV